MGNNQLDTREDKPSQSTRPLQRISWSEKISNDKRWFKNNIDYYVRQAGFGITQTTGTNTGPRDLSALYRIYNNQFPESSFKHFTNPLNARKAEHKNFPAKVRPTAMLRTNIDLLLGEYPLRPFNYSIVNSGEDGFNAYLDSRNKAVQQNLQEHFLAVAQQSMADAGHETEQVPQDQEIPTPEEITDRFNLKYKDNLAVQGGRWMKRATKEYHIRTEQLKMFKDYLITGECRSFKGILNGEFQYKRISPLNLRFSKSIEKTMVEDGEWACHMDWYTMSDVVDMYYDQLETKDYTNLENRTSWWSTPASMYTHLQGLYNQTEGRAGTVPVYHLQWKGMKKVLFVKYTDPFTGQSQEMELDEDTVIDDTMTLIRTDYVNEVYESTLIGEDIYVNMRPVQVQRNAMNNFSKCKLGYNGRNYSDTHSTNLAPLEMGIPYAIMYMLTNFVIEKTIAKSKGKIMLIDGKAIPNTDGWDEEKFFYYADALGYAIMNRNQLGVDKSFNQYQVLDMSLFSDIKNLIEIRDSFSRDWDALLGVTPQRKAQVDTSAGKGTTEQAIFRSTVMTDNLFNLYEEFIESDMNGILDFSKFVNVDGVRGIYNQDDFDKELLSIDPNSYCNAELGLFMESRSQEQQVMNAMKQETQAMQQNGVKQSTIAEVLMATNMSELKEKLLKIEEIETRNVQASAATEHDRMMELEQIKENYAGILSTLKIDEIQAEWDRKDQNTILKGEYDVVAKSQNQKDADPGIDAALSIGKSAMDQFKIMQEARTADKEIASRLVIHKEQMAHANAELMHQQEELRVKEKLENKKIAVDKIKARKSGPKK